MLWYRVGHRRCLCPKSSWSLRKPNTVHHGHPVGLYHVCCQSYCECVWPLYHEAHSLIVTQQAGPTPSLFLGLYKAFANPLPHIIFATTTTTAAATQLLFGLSSGQVLSVGMQPPARPHSWRTVSVYSPFCPLCRVPLADLALQPIPRERTCITVNRLLHLALQKNMRTCSL